MPDNGALPRNKVRQIGISRQEAALICMTKNWQLAQKPLIE
jgi:hypothetical protein